MPRDLLAIIQESSFTCVTTAVAGAEDSFWLYPAAGANPKGVTGLGNVAKTPSRLLWAKFSLSVLSTHFGLLT